MFTPTYHPIRQAPIEHCTNQFPPSFFVLPLHMAAPSNLPRRNSIPDKPIEPKVLLNPLPMPSFDISNLTMLVEASAVAAEELKLENAKCELDFEQSDSSSSSLGSTNGRRECSTVSTESRTPSSEPVTPLNSSDSSTSNNHRNSSTSPKKKRKRIPGSTHIPREQQGIEIYISKVINDVHTHSNNRKFEMKPLDRRSLTLKPNWSRKAEIENDPSILDECNKLIRGSQSCGRDCDARFKTLVEFSEHIDTAHDQHFRPYLCPLKECPWSIVGFHERSECTRHIRTKHYHAIYQCDFPLCFKSYTRSDAFRRHVRQSHAAALQSHDHHSFEDMNTTNN